MSTNNKIRAILAFLITITFLGMGLMTAQFPIYLEVLKQMSIPFSILMAGYFSVEGIKNYIKKNK